MGQLGKFDTDTTTLTARIQAHARYGSKNLDEWVFHHLDVKPTQSILELGCGTGKQTLPLAQHIGENGHITAVDLSAESLAILLDQAIAQDLRNRITVIQADLNETDKFLDGTGQYDRTVACYSLYYAKDPAQVLEKVFIGLKPEGRLFFCGPAHTNNAELKAFHHALSARPVPVGAASFMEELGPTLARRIFKHIDVTTFENPLAFNSAEALYEYWRSYNLYDPELDAGFQSAAREHFRQNATFTTSKRVVGVLATK